MPQCAKYALAFVLAALSLAAAQPPFNVYVVDGTVKTPVNGAVEIEFGDGKYLLARMSSGSYAGDWCWFENILCNSYDSTYTPSVANNSELPKTFSIKVRREDFPAEGYKEVALTINKKPSYKVTFDSDGGSAVPEQTIMKGAYATKPSNPTKTGHAFDNWLNADTVYNFNTPVTANITLKAKWTAKTYTITWLFGNSSSSSQPISYGAIPTPPANTEKSASSGYTYVFNHWEPDAALPYSTEGNKTYTAVYDSTPIPYLITWVLDDGTTIYSSSSVAYGTMPTHPSTNPTKSSNSKYSYAFSGWTPALALVIGARTYTAKFDSTLIDYKIALNTSSNSTVKPDTIIAHYEEALGDIPEPNPRRGYEFDGWYAGEKKYTKETIYDDLTVKTLTAKWKFIYYDIIFHGGGVKEDSSNVYTIEDVVSMPPYEDVCGSNFIGWFANGNFTGEPVTSFTPNANSLGKKEFFSKWETNLLTPEIGLLENPKVPAGLKYDGETHSIETPKQKEGAECKLGEITLLYNGSKDAPKDAGKYALSVALEESGHYKADTLELPEKLVIAKNDEAWVSIAKDGYSGVDKDYDGETKAEIKDLSLECSYCIDGEEPKEGVDYVVRANFISKDAGSGINIKGVIDWLPDGIARNYAFARDSLPFDASADIFYVETDLQVSAPEIYRLLNPSSFRIDIVATPAFLKDSVVLEYSRAGENDFMSALPDRVGDWELRAMLAETLNYSGDTIIIPFTATRGSTAPVAHEIAFKEDGFSKDAAFSADRKPYFVAGPENCSIAEATIQLDINEPDVALKVNGVPPSSHCDEVAFCYEECGADESCATHNRIPLSFISHGLDTLFYGLYSNDGIYSEQDTLLVELPVPFDTVVMQKWNNTLFVNNNLNANGGYDFTDFKWFKNDSAVSNLHFYSAGPKSTDLLKASDTYAIQMNYEKDGRKFRISTCHGSPKIKAAPVSSPAAFQKRVLGIGSRPAEPGAKIYNTKGERANGDAPGVYIIEGK